MKKHTAHLLCAAASSLLLSVPAAHAEKTFTESLQAGSSVKLNFRTRYEDVSWDGLEDSDAFTLRSRLSYQSGAWNGFGLTAEFDDVTEIDNKVDYNNGNAINKTTAVIADPEGTEVNQAFISYTNFNNQIKYGRQRIILDNARFVGNVGWRQNEQTYDAVSISNKTIRYTNIFYAYLNNVNRVFGEQNTTKGATAGDHAQDSHLLNVSYTGFSAGKLIGYSYLLDNKSAAALSTNTYGVRWQGIVGTDFTYNLEYAKQSDAAKNPLSYDVDYILAEGALKVSKFTFTLGYENLGSDNGIAGFATPLATLHAFQGWTDRFLATPANGIKDVYFNVGTSIVGVNLLLSYHDLKSDVKSIDYGTEYDFQATKKFGPVVYTAKYSTYSKDAFGSDTTKFWLMADWSF
ncbi:MAG TPA: alginate export family protein [Cellvibrio sp.]|nr:alginate export family protein [Cellvibrio sp.]